MPLKEVAGLFAGFLEGSESSRCGNDLAELELVRDVAQIPEPPPRFSGHVLPLLASQWLRSHQRINFPPMFERRLGSRDIDLT